MRENTTKKFFFLCIVLASFSAASVLAFADDTNSVLARQYYEKGVELANEGQLDEARIYFEKAIRITQHPQTAVPVVEIKNQTQIKEVVQIVPKEDEAVRLKEQEIAVQETEEKERKQEINDQADEVYNEAVELYNNKEFADAKKKFEEVNLVIPDYKSTTDYLNNIDKDVQEQQERKDEEKQKAIEEQRLKQEEALQKQEADRQAEIEARELQQKADIQEHAQSLYATAVELFDKKHMDDALDQFNAIEVLSPDFKSTRSYIARIGQWKDDQQKLLLKAQVEDEYSAAVGHYKDHDYATAKSEFFKINEEISGYKSTTRYLKLIDREVQEEQERKIKEQQKVLQEQHWEQEVEQRKKQEAESQLEEEAKELQHKADIEEHAQSLYTTAVALFDKKNMDDALDKFNAVEVLSPDFKSTRSYIARIGQWKDDQQKLLLESQKEAEAARVQQEEALRQQMEEKERKDKVNKQAEEIYGEAIQFYKNKDYVDAKKKFEEVNMVIVGYDSTQYYLSKIDDKIREAQADQEHQKELAQERQRAQELKDKTDQTQKVYEHAVDLYRDHQWEEARSQFEAVEQMIPDFKHTRRYLQKIDDYIAEAAAKAAKSVVVPPPPAPVVVVPPPVVQAPPPPIKVVLAPPVQPPVPVPANPVLSVEDQQKQVQEIAALAERSAKLYSQISDVADDNATAQTKKKMAEVNDILNNLKENKEHLLQQINEEQYRRQEEEARAKQKERRIEVENMYHQGVEYLRSHEYAKAKIKFLELESTIPNYRATRRYLSRIEDDLKREGIQVVTVNERIEAGHLKQMQDKENIEDLRHAQEEQEKQQTLEQQQQASLKELAQKSSSINDDIIRLSKDQDYEAVKTKFAELENTVIALTALKDTIAKQKGDQERERQLAREAAEQRANMINEQKQEDQQIHAYVTVEPSRENHPVLSEQSSDLEHYKHREIMQEQNELFNEAVDLYGHKKYTQAKLLFDELSNQQDHRAEAWLKKVDRAITQELLRSQEGEERERTAFIEDQLKAQRELVVIQERERQRQKQLTEELERQKRLYEDDQLLQLRKEETLKAQERERELQEAKRLKLEKEKEKQDQELRFHKIQAELKPQPEVIAQLQPAVVQAQPAVVKPEAMQLAVSPSSEAEEREKIKEEKQREIEHQEELKAQQVEERQAKLKAKVEERERIKEEKQKEIEHQEELKAQEQKHQEDLLHQQEIQRQEQIKQEEAVREEAQHRQELVLQEYQRQAQLEAQREAVRKELENGVEVMYQEALNSYKQGNYTAAADRFKDVQDILPGYKRAQQYMDEARQKALEEPTTPVAAPVSATESRQENISKALDLFDPNAK